MKNKDAIYFLADNLPESEQLRNLGRLVGEHFNDRILSGVGFKNWRQFFLYLKEKATGRLLVTVDEFPYLARTNAAISSIFQKGIDEHLKETPVFLIVAGSSIGMMEREVLFYKAPLYGRRTGSTEVEEMDFRALEGFFPKADFDERLAVYAVTGSVPAYLEKFDPRKSVFANIRDAILPKGSYLHNEVEYILMEELREPRNYCVILRAVAQGKRKLSEIINDTGFEKSLVSRYIDILKNLRYLRKEIPVTEKNPEKSKQGLYRVSDRFFRFCLRYIFPNRSRLEIGDTEYVHRLIKETWDQHISTVYEDLCVDICRSLMSEGVMQYTAAGGWWSGNEEIDVVALDDDTGTAYFGEAKWSAKKVGDNAYADLRRKSNLVNWRNDGRQNKFMLFSRSGFTQRMLNLAAAEDVLLVHKDRVVYRPAWT